jgi:hypothetical protein
MDAMRTHCFVEPKDLAQDPGSLCARSLFRAIKEFLYRCDRCPLFLLIFQDLPGNRIGSLLELTHVFGVQLM